TAASRSPLHGDPPFRPGGHPVVLSPGLAHPPVVDSRCGTLEAEASMTDSPRSLTIEDLAALHWIADPQISPDGSRVVFTRVWVNSEADEYRTALWLVNADGTDLRRLTSGEFDTQPRWSPDAARLAFVRAAEAGKPGQLCVLPMGGGEASVLTKLEKGASDPAWSPDGRRIAFVSRANPALDDPATKKP